MIKFGNKRINLGLVTGYHPSGSKGIEFNFLSQAVTEKVTFESTEKRDEMLKNMDDCFVDWEDGKSKMADVTSLTDLLFNRGSGEGGPPEGATVQ